MKISELFQRFSEIHIEMKLNALFWKEVLPLRFAFQIMKNFAVLVLAGDPVSHSN